MKKTKYFMALNYHKNNRSIYGALMNNVRVQNLAQGIEPNGFVSSFLVP